jgi:chemotaxis protein MotA
MDIATITGLILGIGAVIASFIIEGGHLSSLLQLPAMLLVIGGTFGAATITTSVSQIGRLPRLLSIILFDTRLDNHKLIDLIFDLSQKSRKNGLLSLEDDISGIKDNFLRKAIQITIDGYEVNKIRETLEIEMSYIEERHKAGITFFQKLGGFSPTFGIIGTVLGLIHALGSLEDSSRAAGAIAGAFIATLWGISLANLIYLPISDKLRAKHQEEALYLQIICEGVLSLAMGDNPRVIKMKLLSFLLPNARGEE